MKRTTMTFMLPALLVWISGCYKAVHVQPPPGPVKYNMLVDGAANENNVNTFYLQDTLVRTFFINFSLTSGDPANYPITLTYSDVPAGITGFDSCTFRLNANIRCSVASKLPGGVYPFSINVSTPDGLTTYAARVIIK